MFFTLKNNTIEFLQVIDEIQTTIKIDGLYCEKRRVFLGPVTIHKSVMVGNTRVVFEQLTCTLDPKFPLKDLMMLGVCSKLVYNKNTFMLESREYGVIGNNNQFCVSICYQYEMETLNTILIQLPKPTNRDEFEDSIYSIALFQEHFKDEIGEALRSPCPSGEAGVI